HFCHEKVLPGTRAGGFHKFRRVWGIQCKRDGREGYRGVRIRRAGIFLTMEQFDWRAVVVSPKINPASGPHFFGTRTAGRRRAARRRTLKNTPALSPAPGLVVGSEEVGDDRWVSVLRSLE